jgi:hypothetical protein
MQSLGRGKNNDLYIDDMRNIAISTDLQACLEACESVASTMLGEQIYAQDEGVPNFQALWNGVPNFQQAEVAIRNAIESVENVEKILEFDYLNEGDEFRYNALIKTAFGVGKVYNGL